MVELRLDVSQLIITCGSSGNVYSWWRGEEVHGPMEMTVDKPIVRSDFGGRSDRGRLHTVLAVGTRPAFKRICGVVTTKTGDESVLVTIIRWDEDSESSSRPSRIERIRKCWPETRLSLFRLVCIDAFLQELAPSYARPSLQLCLFTTSAKSFVSPLSRKVDIDLKCIHLTFGEFECTFGVLPLSSNSSVCRAVLDDLERELLNSIDGGVGARITRPLTDSLAYLFPLFSVSSFSFLVAHVEQRWPCTSVCARVVTPGL